MSNCLICNESLIELLELLEFPYFIYENMTDISFLFDKRFNMLFNYCPKCFHCQLSKEQVKSLSNNTKDTKISYIKNIYEDINIFLNENISQNQKDVCVILENNYINNFINAESQIIYDEFTINNFLNIDENNTYDIILFYKSFDKTYKIKSLLNKSKKLLNTNGVIIIITSTECVVKDKKFDLINSSLVSFFSTNSLKTLCDQEQLSIQTIKNFQNTKSYFINSNNTIGNSNDVIKNLYEDINNDLYSDKLYIMFNLKGLFIQNNIRRKLLKLNIHRFELDEKSLIIGWGITPESINLINFCKLSDEYIDYFISFDLASNLLIPGTNILVKNYWKMLSNNEYNHCYVTIYLLNFTKNRINDKIHRHLHNLFNCQIKIIDIVDF